MSYAAFCLQFIIDHQLLPCLLNLLTQNHKKHIKKEACWTILNITAGNKDQIQLNQGCNSMDRPLQAVELSLALVEQLYGKEKADDSSGPMVMRHVDEFMHIELSSMTNSLLCCS